MADFYTPLAAREVLNSTARREQYLEEIKPLCLETMQKDSVLSAFDGGPNEFIPFFIGAMTDALKARAAEVDQAAGSTDGEDGYGSQMGTRGVTEDGDTYMPAGIAIVMQHFDPLADAYADARGGKEPYEALRSATWRVLERGEFDEVDLFIHGKRDDLYLESHGPDFGATFRADLIAKLEALTDDDKKMQSLLAEAFPPDDEG